MRNRIVAVALATISITAGAMGSATAKASAPSETAVSVTDCFQRQVHAKGAHAFRSLIEAQVCTPDAPVFTIDSTHKTGGVPKGFTGAAITTDGNGHYTAHYFAPGPVGPSPSPSSPPANATSLTSSSRAQLAAYRPGAASAPGATLAGCYWYYFTNFSTDNWFFGSAAGTYHATFEDNVGCWYDYGVNNNFYISWAGYSWPGSSQGTYDSNYSNSHGWGPYAGDWVNGDVQTSPYTYQGFWCRGELESTNWSYWYPGCNLS